MKKISNPFKSKFMREAFDNMVTAYLAKNSLLFRADGTPHRGNSWAGMFWRGFEGQQIGVWDRASKETGSYPSWRAGVECAKAVNAAKKRAKDAP